MYVNDLFFFFLDYCSKCSSFVSKTKTTFLFLFIFGKWCIMGFWTGGLVKSTDISFLSSYSGPFLFALCGKGLERFLLCPSLPLFSGQSFFSLIFSRFIASLLLKLRVSFFSPLFFFSIAQKNTFSWLSSIHCQLWTLFVLLVQYPLWNEDHWASPCGLPTEHNCALKVWYCTSAMCKAAVQRAWMHCNFYLLLCERSRIVLRDNKSTYF